MVKFVSITQQQNWKIITLRTYFPSNLFTLIYLSFHIMGRLFINFIIFSYLYVLTNIIISISF